MRSLAYKNLNYIESPKVKKSSLFKLTQLPKKYKLFLLFLEYTQINRTCFFRPHFAYKLIFNIDKYSSIINIELVNLIRKWSSTLLLFMNFSYFSIQTATFGNKFF